MWLNTIQTPSSLLPESIGTMQTMHILYQNNSHVYMDTSNQLKKPDWNRNASPKHTNWKILTQSHTFVA